MFPRYLENTIIESLQDTPAVLLQGARQTGKTTLVKAIAKNQQGIYYNLDDTAVRKTLVREARATLTRTKGLVVIDEIQNEIDLLKTIKTLIDEDRHPGRFLLTGSANVMLLPQVSDSLAGRMETHTLQPLSLGEIEEKQYNIIDHLFSVPDLKSGETLPLRSYLDLCFTGGYPEVTKRNSWAKRERWLRSYTDAMVLKDIKNIAQIRAQYDIAGLLQMLAVRTISPLNVEKLGQGTGIPYSTTERYIKHLQALFIYNPLPVWTMNIDKQVVKAPKVQLVDPALLASLLNAKPVRFKINDKHYGMLIENFVYNELKRQSSWAENPVRFFYFRTSKHQEVDIVMSDASLRIIGVEVKASENIGKHDFKGLEILAEANKDRFMLGIVAYTGDRVLPYGSKMWAIPINRLWLGPQY